MSRAQSTHSLSGKRILLGVSGGIAAYKSAALARLLKKAGADVRVVLTDGARAFITPLTFQALTGNPVHDSLLDQDAEAGMGHIELARWAEILLIAPATANLIARLANGFADDLLATLYLASSAPRYLAPAMNQQMWASPAVQRNVQQLQQDGATLLGPDAGEQACGDVGQGRMLEPEDIINTLLEYRADARVGDIPTSHDRHGNRYLADAALAEAAQTYTGNGYISSVRANDTANATATWPTHQLNIVITAGPTREAIDPVRYLSNYSSGKMGYALALAAQQLGAKVTLVSGPVTLATPEGVTRIDVASANEMLAAAKEACQKADIFIATAAVADFRPATVAEQKIKKGCEDKMTLTLTKNPDIVATIAAMESAPFTVGFAAETESLHNHALEKLKRKKLDMIVANQVGDGLAFGQDNNAATLYWHCHHKDSKRAQGNRESMSHQETVQPHSEHDELEHDELHHEDFPFQPKSTLAYALMTRIIAESSGYPDKG